MSLWNFFLENLPEYQEVRELLSHEGATVSVTDGAESARSHLVHCLAEGYQYRLLITADETRARKLWEEYQNYDSAVWYYPPKDLLFYNADIHSNLLASQRMQVIRQLLEGRGGTIITTIDGCMDPLLPLARIQSKVLEITSEDIINLDALSRQLVYMGYVRSARVEQPGEFCVRGGLIDIYTLTEENPVRIELWDDQVDSLRAFDVGSQRSVEDLERVQIYPATEIVLDEDSLQEGIARLKKECKSCEKKMRDQMLTEEAYRIKTVVGGLLEELEEGAFSSRIDGYVRYFCEQPVCLLDYFPEDTCIFLEEPYRLQEKIGAIEWEFAESMKNRLEKGYILPGQMGLLYTRSDLIDRLKKRRVAALSLLEYNNELVPTDKRISIVSRDADSYQNNIEGLISDLKRWRKNGVQVIILCASRTRGARLADNLRLEYNMSAVYLEELGEQPLDGQIIITKANLVKGFEYPQARTVLITEGDMYGARQKKKKKKRSYEGVAIQSFTDLAVGDYVVHENHGLGIYQGVEKIQTRDTIKDYLKIEYGDGGNLYVPVTQSDLVQKYAGADSCKPKLNKLGGKEWHQTKSKVRAAVQNIARELVELYAARKSGKGYCFTEDTLWQREFEETFPYVETEDQLEAIEAVKNDMQSTKIMDRLVCGDVGYGKTEIAIRAAFKAVQDSKQVVYLVPTTILAQQHYNTFCQRMANYPIRVDLMSRFRTPAQQRQTLQDLKTGLVDILIGTHRVLSKDVQYRDLGLLIVDEEQRFGVTHKEKIKRLKENVDVLTLTATPIPRTLHMSLVGIRDMSVLEEAPLDRMPIQTYVMEHDDEMIREAIIREVARGGQVYYVYNRVQNIDQVTERVAALVPDMRVVFAHGQMSERQLERIMLDFINGDIDVLVSTTIIETGLDISNVNTIIIQEADRFGLSQLYQLRGRVGRSNRTAYAFLTYTRGKVLKEVAEKRLAAIRQFTELGSGIKIAMRDLEIRGAGNLLGAQQHGHMEAVGYDLYCKMLNLAVRRLKNQESEETFESTVEMELDAYIPSDYINNENQKLEMYKKISSIETDEDYTDVQDELIDRYGDIPKPVQYLLKVALLKANAHRAYVMEIKCRPKEISFVLYQKAPFKVENIAGMVQEYRGKLKLQKEEIPRLIYTENKKTLMSREEMFIVTQKILADMKQKLLDEPL